MVWYGMVCIYIYRYVYIEYWYCEYIMKLVCIYSYDVRIYYMNMMLLHDEYFLNIFWIYCEYIVNILWIYCECIMNILWIYWECMVNVLWTYFEYVMNMLFDISFIYYNTQFIKRYTYPCISCMQIHTFTHLINMLNMLVI